MKPLLAITLLAIGCAGPDRSYRISEAFTAEESIAIRSQAAKWCDPALDRITFRDDADGLIELIDDCHDGACVAVTDYPVGEDTTIGILSQRDREDWIHRVEQDALHEFGHALAGYLDNHHLPAGNVMSPTIDTQPDWPTDEDFAFARGER
jgi:hypothetical protein